MPAVTATAPGKMILAGEHAVVYGQPAIAFPIPEIRARVIIEPGIKQAPGSVYFEAPEINFSGSSDSLTQDHAFNRILQLFQEHFHISQIPTCVIKISSTIPIASGLGSGAAVSAAMFRALAGFNGKRISDQEVSDLTFEIEKIFHGNPSGIDNTVVSFRRPIFFIKNRLPEFLDLRKNLTFVLADTGVRSSTQAAVAGVRERWEKSQENFNLLFNEIGNIVIKLKETLLNADNSKAGNLDENKMGNLMNQNQEILEKMGVSTSSLNTLVHLALLGHAYGAKLIGAGLGGCIAALTSPDMAEELEMKFKNSGAAWTLISTFQSGEA